MPCSFSQIVKRSRHRNFYMLSEVRKDQRSRGRDRRPAWLKTPYSGWDPNLSCHHGQNVVLCPPKCVQWVVGPRLGLSHAHILPQVPDVASQLILSLPSV